LNRNNTNKGIVKDKYQELKILMQTIFEKTEKIFESICTGACFFKNSSYDFRK